MSFHCEAEEKLYYRRAELAFKRLSDRYVGETHPFTAEVWTTDERVPFARRHEGTYRPIQEGEVWGRDWATGWFHLTAEVPRAWAGREVVAWLEIGGEGLVYRPDGVALQGITHGSIFASLTSRPHIPLFGKANGGERVELWLEGAANHLFGITPFTPERARTDPTRFGAYECRANRLSLAVVNRVVWDLRLDLDVLFDLYRNLPAGSARRARILRAMTTCAEILARDEQAYAAARASLLDVLSKRANASDIPVRAVGHAHIDTAWLWPLAETVRKVARTFATQLSLIEQYPGYIFGASAAQHYAWMKEHYPELYARVKQAIAEKKWEVQGGMWVEADCNLPSGESFVRQILHGKNFFRDEFGIDVDNLWIPDVFGYAASLPQIMDKSGITTFLTQKISWNQFNEFPFNTFWWQGIDGTRILTHFPPENTYNGTLDPGSLIQGQARFKEKAFVDEVMSLFGVGDGGGGPFPEHVERGLRLRDLEGCPPVRFGTAAEFFTNLRKHGDELKTWVGELYLETHRATQTTQAYVKKCNRRLEHRLRELEMLWTTAPLAEYPLSEFDSIWKTVLLHQFHDIIPGSSIHLVYRETHRNHEDALAACDRLQERFAERHLPADPRDVTFFNSLPEEFVGAVELPESFANCAAVDASGTAIPTQNEEGKSVAQVSIPAQGFATFQPAANSPSACRANKSLVLENTRVRYEFAADGTLQSALEKGSGRETLKGPGNVMSLYHDRPNSSDAWDIEKFYRQEHLGDVHFTVEPLGTGPVRTRLRLSGTIGNSRIVQVVSLAADSPRLDFSTTIDWHEQHRMLRVAFPAAVNADRAACEIQFGHLYRATHENTSWDMAKFEVPAHRWVDISEPGFGLALLNDCKYGYGLLGNVLDLNLLRAPTHPDPDADQGRHTFTYSLLPHKGDFLAGGVLREAAFLNQPPVMFSGRGQPALRVPVTVSGDAVEVAALKRAEKEDCVIVRLVERRGTHTAATLRLAKPARLVETDLLEWRDGRDTAELLEHRVHLAPFEIRTFKVR